MLLCLLLQEGTAQYAFKTLDIPRSTITVSLPAEWEPRLLDQSYRTVIEAEKGASLIRLVHCTSDSREWIKWQHHEEWFFTTFRPGAVKILQVGSITLPSLPTGIYHLIEYNEGGRRWLEKIVLLHNDSEMILLTARSPLSTYEKHESLFRIVTESIVARERLK